MERKSISILWLLQVSLLGILLELSLLVKMEGVSDRLVHDGNKNVEKPQVEDLQREQRKKPMASLQSTQTAKPLGPLQPTRITVLKSSESTVHVHGQRLQTDNSPSWPRLFRQAMARNRRPVFRQALDWATPSAPHVQPIHHKQHQHNRTANIMQRVRQASTWPFLRDPSVNSSRTCTRQDFCLGHSHIWVKPGATWHTVAHKHRSPSDVIGIECQEKLSHE